MTIHTGAILFIRRVKANGRKAIHTVRNICNILIIIEIHQFGCRTPHFQIGISRCSLSIAIAGTAFTRPTRHFSFAGCHNSRIDYVACPQFVTGCAASIKISRGNTEHIIHTINFIERECTSYRAAFQLRTIRHIVKIFPCGSHLPLQNQCLCRITVGVSYRESNIVIRCADFIIKRRCLHTRCPPIRFFRVVCIVSKSGTMITIYLTCRSKTLGRISVIEHVGLPHVGTINRITLYPWAFFYFLQQHL